MSRKNGYFYSHTFDKTYFGIIYLHIDLLSNFLLLTNWGELEVYQNVIIQYIFIVLKCMNSFYC